MRRRNPRLLLRRQELTDLLLKLERYEGGKVKYGWTDCLIETDKLMARICYRFHNQPSEHLYNGLKPVLEYTFLKTTSVFEDYLRRIVGNKGMGSYCKNLKDLKKLELISDREYELLFEAKGFRNGVAHFLGIEEVLDEEIVDRLKPSNPSNFLMPSIRSIFMIIAIMDAVLRRLWKHYNIQGKL